MNRTSKILWKNKYLHKKCKYCKKYNKNLNHMIRKSKKTPNYFLKYSGAVKGKCQK
jgi:hypothetical protein